MLSVLLNKIVHFVLPTGVISSVNIPVLVGSGVTTANVVQYRTAHALIIGSHLKKEGKWYNDLDKERISRFMEQVKNIRDNKITESTLII